MAPGPGTRIGPYELTALLGEGGMGQVYRATDTNLKRQVALKVLPPSVAGDAERLARFQREAEVLASLNHPHIAQIYGIERERLRPHRAEDKEIRGEVPASVRAGGGAPAPVEEVVTALVMELVEGSTLDELIARAPGSGLQATAGLPLSDALPIARQIANALEAAHEQGIVHRDLKPANVKVRPDGTVKVLDFGLAKAVDARPEGRAYSAAGATAALTSPAMTQAGLILGTAAYMAPEQAKGKTVDRRADIWAFGCVLYEMLTGQRAFAGEDVTDTIVSVMSKDPDWSRLPASTPPSIRLLLGRCLEKNAASRLPHIGAARLEIDDAISGKVRADPALAGLSSAVSERTVSAPAPSRRFVPLLTAGVLAACVATALATWAVTRPAAESRPLIRVNAELGPDAISGPRSIAAISRDGRRIVFHVRDDKGIVRLATRLLNEPTETVLPGTEDAYEPFFSPDGQWVAFVTQTGNKLKKVRVDGGAAVTLGDADQMRGGSWGDDDHIVLAPYPASTLVTLPAGGGAPQPLTTLADKEVTHRWPQVLPGSQVVLFTASASTGEWETANIKAVSRKDGTITTLVTGAYFGRYLAGQLLYVSQRTLFAVPFDPVTLRVGATPVPILDDLTSERIVGTGWFDVSDTGTFVYRSGKGEDTLAISWLDSAGTITRLPPSTSGLSSTPRLSPDGQRLALSIGQRTVSDVYVYDFARDAMSRLTFSARGSQKPVWAPDGRHLVYHSPLDMTLSWMRADGSGEPQVLLQGKTIADATAFSPDGRYLVYYTPVDATGSNWDIFRLPLDLTDPQRPKPGAPEPLVTGPSWDGEAKVSPDGRWLSYASGESGRTEVYVRPFDLNVTGKWQISNNGANYATWAKDGRTLYYLGIDRLIMAVDYTATKDVFQPGRPRLWSTRFIRQTPPGSPPLDLAPDGKRFAIVTGDAEGDAPTAAHATFLFNFLDELKRKVPIN